MAGTEVASAGAAAREIDVFCTVHSLSFGVQAAGSISCARDGHGLDDAFPRGAFWEYCCDCQTFVHCDIVKERKANDSCPSCTRQFARRYVCGQCHVIACESDAPARRKQFSFGPAGVPPPTCPGCLAPTPPGPLNHRCEDFGFAFLTPRAECPFCKEPVAAPAAAAGPAPQQPACPNCHAPVKPHFKFCKKCRAPVQAQGHAPAVAPAPAPVAYAEPIRVAPSQAHGALSASPPVPAAGVADVPPAGAPLAAPATGGSQNKKLIAVFAAVIIAGGALAAVAAYRASSSSHSTEAKLSNAIARGDLLAPSGESAQHYYRLLKSEGASAETLSRQAARLTQALTARPYKMLEEFAVAGNSDPSPSEWDEAGRLFTAASEINPQDGPLAARAAYCQGRAAYGRRQGDTALELWRRASDLDRAWALPPNGVGLIHNDREQFDTARTYLAEAIRRDPGWAPPYNNMGTSYLRQKNYDQAAEYYRRAAELAPRWARPHAWLGDIAYQRKDFCGAQQEYQSALDLATPGMTNWNPQRIQSKRDDAAAKCAGGVSGGAGASRIQFGTGGTTATVSGSTAGTDAYVIAARAEQTMSVRLTAQGGGATLQVLDSGMNLLGEAAAGGSWSGTLSYTGDYNIIVTSTGGVAAYTLRVTIPPLG